MFVAGESGAGEAPGIAALVDRKADIARELARVVRDCVSRRDTAHAAFHGCIDWHSAVHGVWALTAYGQMTGDRQHDGLLGRILSPANVAAEHRLIRTRPDFEMPYGRAWFLRLAREHEQATGDDVLKSMAVDVLASMLTYYRRQAPDPRRGSYESDSWALINMQDYAAHTGNEAALQAVRTWIELHFVRHPRACDYAHEAGHFMAVCTNWAWLVSRTLPKPEFDRWAETFFADTGLPRPVTAPANWHHHGLNFSRSWGLWALSAATGSATARKAYRESYVAHFQETYKVPRRWRGSYEGVAHWVPQFGMLALQPLFAEERR